MCRDKQLGVVSIIYRTKQGDWIVELPSDAVRKITPKLLRDIGCNGGRQPHMALNNIRPVSKASIQEDLLRFERADVRHTTACAYDE